MRDLAVVDLDVPPARLARIKGLDGLRGIAVLMVILFHAQVVRGGAEPGQLKLVASGWVGVDVFFVMSGFLITGILRRTRDHDHFYRVFALRRALRIFPPYFLLLAIVVPAVSFSADVPPAWVYPTFVSNFWLATFVAPLALTVTWSLAIEEQFYLFWPSIVRRLSLIWMTSVCIGIVNVTPLVRFFLHDPDNQVAYMWSFCRMDSLAWGALTWVAFELKFDLAIRLARRIAPFLTMGCVAFFSAVGDVRSEKVFGVIGYTVLSITAAAIILSLATESGGILNRIMNFGPLERLGRVSYGAYLYHVLILVGLSSLIKSNFLMGALLSLILTYGFASIVFRTIEEPLLRKKDRWAPY